MKTIKKSKSAFTVDLRSVKDPRDIYVCFALAKQEANLPISNIEFENFISFVVDTTRNATISAVFNGHNAAVIENGRIRPMTATKVDPEKEKECECKDEQPNPKANPKKKSFIKRLFGGMHKK